MIPRRKVQDWIARRLAMPPAPTRFALYHVGRHQHTLVCHLGFDGAATADVPALIERQASEESAAHVEAWAGRQTYVVRAYGADEAELGEVPFALSSRSVRASGEADAMGMPTVDQEELALGQLAAAHPGDVFSHPAALVTVQQMRHNESLARSLIDVAMASRERDAAIIASLSRRLETEDKRRLDTYELIEQMLSRSQERAIEQKKFDQDEARKERMLEKLTGLVLPEFAKRAGLLATSAKPTSTSVDGDKAGVAAIREIFLSMPEEIQDQIAKAISDDEFKTLMAIFHAAGEDAGDTTEPKGEGAAS